MKSRRFKQTTLMTLLCLAILAGVALARSGHLIDASWWWLMLVPLVWTWRKRTAWTVLFVLLFGLSLGWWRGSIYMTKLTAYNHYYYRTVTISAKAIEDATYDKHKQLSFAATNVVVQNTGERLTGKVNLSGFGLPAVFAGDVVTTTGKLYPSLGSYQGRISYAEMTVQAHKGSAIDVLRRKFAAGIRSTLPEPLGSFGMGLLIGQRSGLPDDITQTLLMVGLTHIIAVSGYNLTILLRASQRLMGKRSKRQTMLFALGLIALFLLFTGSSASIVRAAIVSVLSIAATYYGRSVKPIVLIALAAAITGFAYPFYEWADSAWYLSFLAFYGVMVLAPLVSHNWSARYKNNVLAMVALESLCAEIMTLPFVLHVFGQMSFVGLVANVLVVALVPLAMLLSFIAGLSGLLVPAIAGWLAWPATLVLTYMLDVSALLSRLPHVFVQNIAFGMSGVVVMYAVVIGLSWLLWRKRRPSYHVVSLGETSPHPESELI